MASFQIAAIYKDHATLRGYEICRLMANAYTDPRWMTYKQAQGQGWQVRGGEKGTQIQHWIWEEARPRLGKDGKP